MKSSRDFDLHAHMQAQRVLKSLQKKQLLEFNHQPDTQKDDHCTLLGVFNAQSCFTSASIIAGN
jgi:hypothetical protein